jgi:DNA-binding GntR family transcriptional regulator
MQERPDVHTTLAAQIYERLANRILIGDLPPGYRLDEQRLALEFGVSRTPVREALRKLGARQLIDLIPRKGGMVMQPAGAQLIDMLEAECEIEGLCARLAAHRMSALEKGELREAHESVRQAATLADYFERNRVFHDLISSGAHNETLDTCARDMRSRLSPFRRSPSDSDVKAIIARTTREHAAIVDAIVAGDADAAYEATRSHCARVNLGAVKLLQSEPIDKSSGISRR